MRNAWFGLGILGLVAMGPSALAAKADKNLQAGLGAGGVSSTSLAGFPYALQGVVEGTYRWKALGLSVLATITSSPKTNGTYWFGTGNGQVETLVEPRLYLGWFHLGLDLGVVVSSETVTSVGSFGGSAGVEVPIGRFSLGADARYLQPFTGSNPNPLAILMMLRFKL